MGFFDDSDDDEAPAPAPTPAPAPPVTAPTVSARRDPSDDLPDLPRVSIMDRLEQRSIARSTLPPAPMAAPPTPPQAVTREPKRKPFDEEEEEEVVGQCSSGAGSSSAPYRQLPSLADINANYEARTNTLALEEVRKGKAPMRAASKGAPSGVGTADKGKRVAQEKIYQRQLYKQGQEGLVLHQRDENRYFEGVMGDKNNKGELFGHKSRFS